MGATPTFTALGKIGTDSITGYSGTITAVAYYLDASARVQISAPIHDGKYVDPVWFDIDRIIYGA